MKDNFKLENWLRGEVEGVPDLLQPAAHALLQTREEAIKYLQGFHESLLWEKPAGRASVAFHLQHIAGVTNRLITYSKGEQLCKDQLEVLAKEGIFDERITVLDLLVNLKKAVDEALKYLMGLQDLDLLEKVEIGRKKVPSTQIGVLFHAAEHSQRHIGQMLVTISVLKNEYLKG